MRSSYVIGCVSWLLGVPVFMGLLLLLVTYNHSGLARVMKAAKTPRQGDELRQAVSALREKTITPKSGGIAIPLDSKTVDGLEEYVERALSEARTSEDPSNPEVMYEELAKLIEGARSGVFIQGLTNPKWLVFSFYLSAILSWGVVSLVVEIRKSIKAKPNIVST